MRKRSWKFLYRFLIKVALTVLAAYLLASYVVLPVRMAGSSMGPSLQDGDLCLFYAFGSPYVGSVVLYEAYDGRHTGRIVAKGGQEVDFPDNAPYTVDGYAPFGMEGSGTEDGTWYLEYPYTVPERQFFILNDDLSDTDDSRLYGAVDGKDIRGRLLFLFRRRDF